MRALAAEVRGDGADVMAVILRTLLRAKEVFARAEGRVTELTAVQALDHQGSCTSCANLVAALLRGAGVPARVLAGYPLWSGPLQTHYIVEAFVPAYGWYPVESTLGRAPWPNHQQVNVSIVPVEHESRALAGARICAGGAVPYMTLTEYDRGSPVVCEGTLKPWCDHQARLVRDLEGDAAAWRKAQEWARRRWNGWLDRDLEVADGALTFGPAAADLRAERLEQLRRELP